MTRSFFVFCALLVFSIFAQAEVRIWEETLTLPTYTTQAPEKNPHFYVPAEYQRAQKHIYPYPYNGSFDAEKKNVNYVGVFLENEYVKVCVTPEMGGRLYYAVDKTNGYDIIYHNHVVKPALIGMTGAWTSGGVEWNIPHHHRPTSFMPVDYTLSENPDGSKTVWVGEYEKRSQTRWIVGITLEPGKSYVKTEFRYFNVTPVQNTFLFWANTAVHANENYQVIFPPDVEKIVYHTKSEFANWPIPNAVYQKIDFTQGQNISWWKNTTSPCSFFAYGSRQGFMGGIDHGKNAGTIKVSDRYVFPGLKFWNWGPNDVGRGWDLKLTDEDGPYLELMMGGYSDNQPDYSFINPMSTKRGTIYYYGIKNMEDIKEATSDFAINLDKKGEKAVVQVNATSDVKNLTLEVYAGERVLFQDKISLTPSEGYTKEIPVDADLPSEWLGLRIFSEEKKELIAWQPTPKKNLPHPEVYKEPVDPAAYKNNDDLLLAGLRLEQFANAYFDPEKYYKGALSKESDDFVINSQLGTYLYKRGLKTEAEKYLQTAVKKVTANHIRPKYAEPLYYLGLCLADRGDLAEACEYLYRATWNYEWTSPAFTVLARLEYLRGNVDRAIDNTSKALTADPMNIEALLLKSVLLRRIGNFEDAKVAAEKVITLDPLNFTALNELALLSEHLSTGKTAQQWLQILKKLMRNQVDNYLESAARYGNAGFYQEAINLLTQFQVSGDQNVPGLPMIDYHLGYYYDAMENKTKAKESFASATNRPLEYCFPYGDVSRNALEKSLEYFSEQPSAYYLLGNLYCNNRHDKAIENWKKAISLNGNVAVFHRNLAFALANYSESAGEASIHIRKAIELDNAEPLFYVEAFNYMEYAKESPEKLADFFMSVTAKAPVDPAVQAIDVRLKNYFGKYDEAITVMEKMRYRTAERAPFNMHVYWLDAHVQQGICAMEEKRYDEAERNFLRALEHPANLEAERDSKEGAALYYLGMNQKRRGNNAKAKEYFGKMIDYHFTEDWGSGYFIEVDYYKGVACRELGDENRAREYFQAAINAGEKEIAKAATKHPAMFYPSLIERKMRDDRLADAYFAKALGYYGLGKPNEAQKNFEKVLEIRPLHFGVKVFREQKPAANVPRFFRLKNNHGMAVELSDYGARITSLIVPDKNGKPVDVVLGYDGADGYLQGPDPYFGATVGRYAGRINHGAFTLNGSKYRLTMNEKKWENHLHGGEQALHNSYWTVEEQTESSLRFTLRCKDGDEGYPGNFDVWVNYVLSNDNEIRMEYVAKTDKPSVCNLTHHSYFNLAGAGEGDVLDHVVWMKADRYTPIQPNRIPTGEIRSVKESAFDFREPKTIGLRNRSVEQQIKVGTGYNHNFVFAKKPGEYELVMRVFAPITGITMEVWTTEPAVQFCDCGWFDGSIIGRNGKRYERYAAFTAEMQHFPDSPNRPDFPSTRHEPGKPYTQTTTYRFYQIPS